MRYPASEKLEIIRQVEQSHLPAKRTLDMLGIPRTTFYRWYDRYLSFGAVGLDDRPSRPARVWNRIPDKVRKQIVDLALEQPELSPRELVIRFTDSRRYLITFEPVPLKVSATAFTGNRPSAGSKGRSPRSKIIERRACDLFQP